MSGECSAGEKSPWTKTDTELQAAVTVVTVMDWAQTLHIARNPEKFEERDPIVAAIIGKHPTTTKVNALIGSCIVANAYIAYRLPQPYRRYWQGFWIVTEGAAVTHNCRVGIEVRF